LPIIGSLYPLVRGSGISNQDLANNEYQSMKLSIEKILKKYDGIIYASGHEHAIQILNGVNENLYVVSGAGIWGHAEESIGEGDDTIFTGEYEGFVMLDYLSNGKIKLSVIKVLNNEGDSIIDYSMWLKNVY
jgi:hypothetical protein